MIERPETFDEWRKRTKPPEAAPLPWSWRRKLVFGLLSVALVVGLLVDPPALSGLTFFGFVALTSVVLQVWERYRLGKWPFAGTRP